jgi:hypothetical protein
VISRVIASVILLSASSAGCEGLRGLAIGDLCTAAFDVEVATGSQPTRPISEIQPNDVVVFKGTHGNRPALIGFTCADGIVTRQLIAFTLKTKAEAQAVFDQQYNALVDLFGAPCTDWRKLSIWRRFKLWAYGLPPPDLLGVDWNLGNGLQARLNTSAMSPGRDSWSVTVAVSGPPQVLMREPDRSEHRFDTPTECLDNS